MNLKELRKIYDAVQSKKNMSKYTAQYIDFIKDAYAMATHLEKEKDWYKKNKKERVSEREKDLQQYYKNVQELIGIYNRKEKGKEPLNIPGTKDWLVEDSEVIRGMEDATQKLVVQMRDFTMRSLSDQQKNTDAVSACSGFMGNIVKNLADVKSVAMLNSERKLEADAKPLIAGSMEQISKQQNDFLNTLTPEQSAYLTSDKKGPANPSLDWEAYRNMDNLIATLPFVMGQDNVPEKQRAEYASSILALQGIYYENMVRTEGRGKLTGSTQSQELRTMLKNVGKAFSGLSQFMADSSAQDPDQADLNRQLQDVMNAINDDLSFATAQAKGNTMSQNEGKRWMAEKEETKFQEQKEQRLAEENHLQSKEQIQFQRMLEANPEFDKCVINENIKAVLGTDDSKLPEEMKGQLEGIRQGTLHIGVSIMRYFNADKDGNTVRPTGKELYDIATECDELNGKIQQFIKGMNKAGIEDQNLVSILGSAQEDIHSKIRKPVGGAANYIDANADEDKKGTVRPFSMYELQGGLDPRMGGFVTTGQNLLDEARFLMDNKKEGGKEDRYLGNFTESLNTFLNKDLPAFMKISVQDDDFKYLTAEDINKFNDRLRVLDGEMNTYREAVKKKKTEHNDKLLKMADALQEGIRQKSEILDYLKGDMRGQNLADDVAQFNADEAERGKGEDSLYDEKKAKTLIHAQQCKDLMNNKMLLGIFLFEDPQSQRGSEILSMRQAQKNIAAVDRFHEEVSKIPWREDGTRDLSHVPEYGFSADQTGSPEHVTQFAVKNDWDGFQKAVDKGLDNAQKGVKNITIQVKDRDGNVTEKNLEVAALMKARIEAARKNNRSLADFTDDGCNGFNKLYQDVLADGETFVGYRDREGEKKGASEKRLERFMNRLDRDLRNAGLSHDVQEKLKDDHIPDNYREPENRQIAREMFAMKNLTRNVESMDGRNQMPMEGSRADAGRNLDVELARIRQNHDRHLEKGKKVYTTTDDFRESDFVGGIRGGTKEKSELITSLEGKSAQEIEEIRSKAEKEYEKEKEQILKEDIGELRWDVHQATKYGILDGDDLMAIRSSMKEKDTRHYMTYGLIDQNVFENATTLHSMADLQIMDYLTGVPTREARDLCMEFSTDQNGKAILTNIGAADSSRTRPFMKLSEKEEKELLIQPEDMKVMSEEMYRKVRAWNEGKYTKEEKDFLGKLDKEAREGFERRVKKLAKAIEPPETEHRDLLGTQFEGRGSAKYSLDLPKDKIRVLNFQQFENLNLDDLTVGKNEARPKDKGDAKPQNLFDTMWDLPQKCSDALVDKTVDRIINVRGKFRQGYDDPKSRMWAPEKQYREMKADFDKKVNARRTDNLMRRVARIRGSVALMHNLSQEKENFWHRMQGDSKEYTAVVDAEKNLQATLKENFRLVVEASGSMGKLSAERQEAVKDFNKRRLEFMRKLGKEQGWPDKDIPAGVDDLPHVNNDPYVYHMTMEALNDFQSKVQTYLIRRKDPSSEIGKYRYSQMVELYDTANNLIAEHASLTGDTSISPSVTVKKGDYNVSFANMYEDRTEFEKSTPYYHNTALKTREKLDEQARKKNESGELRIAGFKAERVEEEPKRVFADKDVKKAGVKERKDQSHFANTEIGGFEMLTTDEIEDLKRGMQKAKEENKAEKALKKQNVKTEKKPEKKSEKEPKKEPKKKEGPKKEPKKEPKKKEKTEVSKKK